MQSQKVNVLDGNRLFQASSDPVRPCRLSSRLRETGDEEPLQIDELGALAYRNVYSPSKA